MASLLLILGAIALVVLVIWVMVDESAFTPRAPFESGVWYPVYGAEVSAYWRHASGMTSAPYEQERIAEALAEAINLLTKHTEWPRSMIWAGLNGVRILVQPDEAGPDNSTPNLYNRGMVVVGPSLRDLLHELAHVVEARIVRHVDVDHHGWKHRRLDQADVSFRAWLNVI